MNQVLGQIGGYTALAWMFVRFAMLGYENHKFNESLLSNIFVCTVAGPDSEPCRTEAQAQKVLRSTITSENRLGYTYGEVLLTRLATLCCCCCHGREWLRKRKER